MPGANVILIAELFKVILLVTDGDCLFLRVIIDDVAVELLVLV